MQKWQEKPLFLKFSTGASGYGTAAAAGIALALKRAKADGVKVMDGTVNCSGIQKKNLPINMMFNF
ncbi:MAG: hypothetical protein PF518_00245 [Spirochaetaceae bacterium]|nr:hypothetical protein [Spirochaetaceae bacterium]